MALVWAGISVQLAARALCGGEQTPATLSVSGLGWDWCIDWVSNSQHEHYTVVSIVFLPSFGLAHPSGRPTRSTSTLHGGACELARLLAAIRSRCMCYHSRACWTGTVAARAATLNDAMPSLTRAWLTLRPAALCRWRCGSRGPHPASCWKSPPPSGGKQLSTSINQ